MEFIHYDMQKNFIFGIKANRLIASSNEERKKGQYQNLKTLGLKDRENLQDLQKRRRLHRDFIPCYQRLRQ